MTTDNLAALAAGVELSLYEELRVAVEERDELRAALDEDRVRDIIRDVFYGSRDAGVTMDAATEEAARRIAALHPKAGETGR